MKIGDFGLMQDGRKIRNRNPQEMRAQLSVRWMALESLTQEIFTSMTDMVSTLWSVTQEMFTSMTDMVSTLWSVTQEMFTFMVCEGLVML